MAYVKLENSVVIQKSCKENDGFVEAPDYVICGMVQQDDGSFVAPTKTDKEIASKKRQDIKAESMRRILRIAPEWKQRNLLAQANILNRKGEANWTQEEANAWSEGEALWNSIAAIRVRSNELEAKPDSELITLNIKEDSLWG